MSFPLPNPTVLTPDGHRLDAVGVQQNFDKLASLLDGYKIQQRPQTLTAQSTTTRDGALSGNVIYQEATITLTPGTWIVEAETAILNLTTTDGVAVGLYNRSAAAEIAGCRGVVIHSETTLQRWCWSGQNVVTVAANTDVCPYVVRNGASTIRVGATGAGSPVGKITATQIAGVPSYAVYTPSMQLVSALPPAPIDGQEIYYQGTATYAAADTMVNKGLIWHFRYNAGSSSAFKWECLGGSKMMTGVGDEQLSATINTWIDSATIPRITVPLAGDYRCFLSGNMRGAGGGVSGYIGLANGAVAPIQQAAMTTHVANNQNTAAFEAGYTNVAAGSDLRMRFYQGQASSYFNNKLLSVMPIRVG